jgi:hypothetical protein
MTTKQDKNNKNDKGDEKLRDLKPRKNAKGGTGVGRGGFRSLRKIMNTKLRTPEIELRGVAWNGLLGRFLVCLLVVVAQAGFAQTPAPGLIAYTMPDPYTGPDGNELWLVNSNYTNNHRLNPRILLGGIPDSTASLGRPTWSRNGTQIVADAILTGTSANVMVVFNPVTGQGNAVWNTTTGTGPSAWDWIYKAFSPDGKRLVYGANQLDYTQYGFINTDGTGETFLGFRDLTSEAFAKGVDWSPRTDALGAYGKLLVVSDSYTINADPTCADTPRTFARLKLVLAVYNGMNVAWRGLTMPPQQPCSILSYTTTNDLYPVFSPDGTRVAFVRQLIDSGGPVLNSTIMTINVSTGSVQKLLYLSGEEVDNLSWSPDGTQLLFDRIQVNNLYLTPLGVWITSSNGGGTLSRFAYPPAFAAAWN